MIVSVLVFLFTFILYCFGISHSVYGGDNADIILASWFGGVAHPPGYPLNTMIGWVFTHLPYQATVAFKANVMAAFLQALTVSLVYLILKKLTRNNFVSLSTALILAFNPLFWLYAHTLEVFQLNLVLVGLTVYFLVSFKENVKVEKKSRRGLYLAFLFYGLAVFHHQTSVLLFPAIVYFVIKTNKKLVKNRRVIVDAFLFFCLGFLPYLFIPLAALRQTPINWDDARTLPNFVQLITRADYGTFTASSQIFGTELKIRFFQIADFFIFLKSDFSIWGIPLILIGAVYAYLKNRKVFNFVLFSVILVGPFFFFYSSFPLVNDFYLGLWERFILLSYFLLTIYVGFSLKLIFDLLLRFINKFLKVPALSVKSKELLVGGVLLLIPMSLFFNNYPKADLSRFELGDWLAQDALASVGDNSILLIFADTITFNTQYVLYTSHNPANTKLILAGQLRHLEYRAQVMKFYPELIYPNDFMDKDERDSTRYLISLIKANLDKFPIYATDYFPPTSGYKWMKVGLTKKLVKENEYSSEKLISINDALMKSFKYRGGEENYGYQNYLTSHIQAIYYNSYIDLSDELMVNGSYDEALKYLLIANKLFPDRKEVNVRLGNISARQNKCVQAKDYFEKAFLADKNDWRLAEILSGLYKDCVKDEAKAREYNDAKDRLKNSQQNSEKF